MKGRVSFFSSLRALVDLFVDLILLAIGLLILPSGEGDRYIFLETAMLGRAVPLDSYLPPRFVSKIFGSAASSMALNARSRTAFMLGQTPLDLLEKSFTM